MKYKEIRDRSLQLLNQYSIAGSVIEESYNNQQDYLNRIPALVNDAMTYIATTAKRIPAVQEIVLEEVFENHGMYEIPLPVDCYQISPSGLLRFVDGRAERCASFRRAGNNLYLPKDAEGEYALEYYRYPQRLELNPDDDDEIDSRVDAQHAIPFYVAAHIVLHDDPGVRDVLMNEFETRLSRLSEEQYVEQGVVEDVYGWGNDSGY